MEFDHFNITAPIEILERVKTFYCQVFDLEVGVRPNFSRAGFWLYAPSNPSTAIIHLTESAHELDSSQQGYLNHLAFKLSNLSPFEQKLKAMTISYKKSKVPDTTRIQLFFTDPVGTRLEAIFEE